MTRQTLKTLCRRLPTVLLIGLLAPVGAAEMPAELQTLTNRLDFVAGFAFGCDIRLNVFGLDGLAEHDCQVFLTEFPLVQRELLAIKDALGAAEDAALQSGNRALQRQFSRAAESINRSMARITKTVDRIKFLQDAERRTPKPRGQTPTK